jgi:hypothetical protein
VRSEYKILVGNKEKRELGNKHIWNYNTKMDL